MILDINATILDLAGIKIPPYHDGQSIIPLLSVNNIDWKKEIFIQISESQVARVIRTKRWKLCIEDPDRDPWNDSYSLNFKEANFYDLDSDPYELNNLIGINEFESIIQELKNRLINLIKLNENIDIKISKSKKIDNPGQLGLTPGAFLDGYD